MINNKKYLLLSLLLVVIIISLVSTLPNRLKSKIGVININGTIVESEEIVENLIEFNNRGDIKGIIIRLNTPGGGVAASQEIYEQVKLISEQNKKPIFASMGSSAASGGYYIALGADLIIANAGTVTGSIGVIMGYPTATELFDNIGLDYKTIKSGKYKDSGSLFRNQNIEDKEYFQDVIDDMHSQFVDVLIYERNLAVSDAINLSNGKIYTGLQAKKLNLIDSIGTFDHTVTLLSEELGLDYRLDLIYPDEKNEGILSFINSLSTFLHPKNFDMLPLPQFKLYYDIK